MNTSPSIGSDGTVYIGSKGEKLYAIGGVDEKEEITDDTEDESATPGFTIPILLISIFLLSINSSKL